MPNVSEQFFGLHRFAGLLAAALFSLGLGTSGRAAEIKLLTRPQDPYGIPRPSPGEANVPLRTSYYFELGLSDKSADHVLAESVAIDVQPQGGDSQALLLPGRRFAPGYSGKLTPGESGEGPLLRVYVDSDRPLRPVTRYTLHVQARSQAGAVLATKAGTWQFTTEATPAVHRLHFTLPANAPVVHWQGGFFTGFCNVCFGTGSIYRIPTYDLMEQVRRTSPRAWSFERDFWLSGMDYRPTWLPVNLPNIVRERETRRITSIESAAQGTTLRVEDFLGHEQYGISSDRPICGDYHPGDEVLIADGLHDARARVLVVNDRKRTVLVTRVDPPSGGWKLDYVAALPSKEDPNAPGLFPPGGCYLRKYQPCGTPAYYWGRLDHEWDLAVKRYNRRVLVNFADAPGDLARDGRSWTTAKDYAELHEVTRAITSHILDRYGDAALSFPWSMFNEPDLGALFWRADWDELQKFYDHSVDGILRAFEEHGYDSRRAFVGGLELGGIFGIHLRLHEFLTHCSPRARPGPGVLVKNAAFADPRLDGKRSRRLEALCRANDGRGSPCDFISIHAYNRSQLMADKLARTKEMALEIDPDYYAGLRINSHESCPGWEQLPDPAYADSYRGNGYFPTWCADVARRQLQRAAADPRYAGGESILTVWHSPPNNFDGANDCVRAIQVEGRPPQAVTVPMPILHFLGLLAAMGPEYRVLPEQAIGGHVVSGFVSSHGPTLRVLLYAHNMLDTQSRSEAEFEIQMDLPAQSKGRLLVREHRFDKDHNSYFRLAHRLGSEDAMKTSVTATQAVGLQEVLDELASKRRESQLAALMKLEGLGQGGTFAAGPVFVLLGKTDDPTVRERATAVLKQITAPKKYPASVVREVEKQAALQQTGVQQLQVDSSGRLSLTVRVAANGANFLVIEPVSRH
jgi:hypothetical protein